MIIPNFVSPFKIDNIDITQFKDRIEIINSYIITLNPNLQSKIFISDYEIKKNEVSFTIDTLNYIQNNINQLISLKSNSNFQYYFLIGDDNLNHFDKWKNWEMILDTAILVVAVRLENKENIEQLINQKYSKYNSKIQILENPIYEISATEIRYYLEKLNKLDKLENVYDTETYLKLNKLINKFTLESIMKK